MREILWQHQSCNCSQRRRFSMQWNRRYFLNREIYGAEVKVRCELL